MRTRVKILRHVVVLGFCSTVLGAQAWAQEGSPLEKVIDSIIARENDLVREMKQYHPLVETYLQTLEPDRQLGAVPQKDDYFLGRLDMSKMGTTDSPSVGVGAGRELLSLLNEFYRYNFKPDGFARMIVLDPGSFDRQHYDFEFVRREFLGDVRTLVFEVRPRASASPDSFVGRIWVEDERHAIVRYNGTCGSGSSRNLHFDSWRLNLETDRWYPAYVYTEEADVRPKDPLKARKFKGQTRIWGYAPQRRNGEEEFTKLMVEDPRITDRTESPGDLSPVKSLRAWEREAEENVLQRLEKGSLLAPEGDVDEVLRTVVTNLEITNHLDIQPPVRCRVLLTSPLESFTIGHTIVLSRGLIDVLPDEASLATVLAHELGHILLGHQLDTRYAFSDQMQVDDKGTIERFYFRRDPIEETEADEKAMMLLQSSPYKEKLGNAGLFLKVLSTRAKALRALIRPHFGNRLAKNEKLYRMTRIADGAPELYPTALNQRAALPLGGRVKVDPWTGRIELMKGNQVVLLSPREKMPFEVAPLMPHLVRLTDPAERTARAGATRGAGAADGPGTISPADSAPASGAIK